MADTTVTIGGILKDTFYAAHAKGVKLNYRDDNESKTPLTKRQADDLTNLINGFLKELGEVQDIANVQFEISSGAYTSVSRYTAADPVTLNLPCMRNAYNGKDSMTFSDYLENLKIALVMATKITGWTMKYNLQSCNVNLEYEPVSGYEQYMKKIAVFEEKVLAQFTEKYKQCELDLKLNSNGSYDFNYTYNAYNKKGRLGVGFAIGDINMCDFSDIAESAIIENARSFMEIVDMFIKQDKMTSSLYLDFYDGHIRKYYQSMRIHYMEAIAELTETLLKDTPAENLSVGFGINQAATFDYSSYSGKKAYRFTLPYPSPRLILRTESKNAPTVYKEMNKSFLKMIEWSKKVGVSRLNFDRTVSDRLMNDAYFTDLLEGLKKFIEEKLEIGQRANMTINITSPANYVPERNTLSFFSIPIPDCYDDELKTYLPAFLAGMKVPA